MRALTDLRARVMQYHALNLPIPVDFNLCPAVLLIAEGEAYILKARGKSTSTLNMIRKIFFLPFAFPLDSLPGRLDALDHGDRTWRRRA